jgi:hypothetical protein
MHVASRLKTRAEWTRCVGRWSSSCFQIYCRSGTQVDVSAIRSYSQTSLTIDRAIRKRPDGIASWRAFSKRDRASEYGGNEWDV